MLAFSKLRNSNKQNQQDKTDRPLRSKPTLPELPKLSPLSLDIMSTRSLRQGETERRESYRVVQDISSIDGHMHRSRQSSTTGYFADFDGDHTIHHRRGSYGSSSHRSHSHRESPYRSSSHRTASHRPSAYDSSPRRSSSISHSSSRLQSMLPAGMSERTRYVPARDSAVDIPSLPLRSEIQRYSRKPLPPTPPISTARREAEVSRMVQYVPAHVTSEHMHWEGKRSMHGSICEVDRSELSAPKRRTESEEMSWYGRTQRRATFDRQGLNVTIRRTRRGTNA